MTDISPVRGAGRAEIAGCKAASWQGKLADLSPLKGMPLTSLTAAHAGVRPVAAERHDTDDLVCSNTQVSDLSPLKGMPLTDLNCDITQVSDLSPLKGMPLTTLDCASTKVSDLSPLQGMP